MNGSDLRMETSGGPLWPKARNLMALGVLSALVFAVDAAAEAAGDRPISIQADTASFNAGSKTRIFEGAVVLTRGTLTVRAARITVQDKSEDGGSGSMVEAQGKPVTLRDKPSEETGWIDGRADRMTMESGSDVVNLFGGVVIKDSSTIIEAATAIYHADTGNFVTGATSQDGQTTTSSGRTTITISTDE